MARIPIAVGSAANDGTGDPLRTAFQSINTMTTELYLLPPIAHATLSSSVTITPASRALAYPIPFESTDDILSLYRQSGVVTVNNSTPAKCTVTWANHLLAVGSAVVFTGASLPTGITAGTVYYVATTNFTTGTFELAATFSSAAPVSTVVTTSSGSGTCTCVSRIYVAEAGDYLFNISAIISTATNTDATFDVWFVQGNSTSDLTGTAIAKSNTQVLMVTTGQRVVLAVPLILDLLAGDFIRLDCRTGSDGNLSLVAIAAVTASGTTPAIPATPSIIFTINKVCT